MDDQGCVLFHSCTRDACSVIDSADLGGLHLHRRAFLQFNDCRRIHKALSGACSLPVMLLDIADLRVLSDKKAVHAVMLGVPAAAVGNTASGDDGHVTVFSDKEVIVDQLLKTGLTDDDRDMHTFLFRSRLNNDIDALLVFLGDDIDIRRSISGRTRAIAPYVVCALRQSVERSYFAQQIPLNRIHFLCLLSGLRTLLVEDLTARPDDVDGGEYLIPLIVHLDPAVLQINDLIRDPEDPFLVGNDNNTSRCLLVQILKDMDQALEAPEVNTRFRFVKEGELRSSGCSHGDLDALHFPAGER